MNPIRIISIAGVIGVAGALAVDLAGSETTGLENAHRAGAMPGSCSTEKHAGQVWAVCQTGSTAPTVWHQHGESWVAANGQAQKLRERLQAQGPGPYQDLPALLDAPRADMPASISARLR